jgi:hypothetical protein
MRIFAAAILICASSTASLARDAVAALIDSIEVDCTAYKRAGDGTWTIIEISPIKVGNDDRTGNVPSIPGRNPATIEFSGVPLSAVLDKKCK